MRKICFRNWQKPWNLDPLLTACLTTQHVTRISIDLLEMLDIVFGDILDVIDPIGYTHLARGWSIVSMAVSISMGMWVAMAVAVMLVVTMARSPVAPISSIMIVIGVSGVMVVMVTRWVPQRSIVPVHNLRQLETNNDRKITYQHSDKMPNSFQSFQCKIT